MATREQECRIQMCHEAVIEDGLCERHIEKRRRYGTCVIPDCDKPISRPALGWCEMHYYRKHRHGSPDIETVRPPRVFRKLDRGYIAIRDPEHPLAHGNWVYEHRRVLYAVLGPEPQECWWCGVAVGWEDDLQVDHLDHDRSNNNPANLVPSCRACNMGRGNGCDPEAWAIGMATRRVLREHAAEFVTEVARIKARLEAVPYEGLPVAAKAATVAKRGAAHAVYEEITTGRPRGFRRKRRKEPDSGSSGA